MSFRTSISNTRSTVSYSADSKDLFGRLYVAAPYTLFDSKQTLDNGPLYWDEELETGSGISSSHSVNRASTTITSTVNTAGKFTRQTRQRFNYQPGKEYGAFLTGIIRKSGSGTGTEATIGLIDDNNGLAFVDKAGTMNVRIRSSITGSKSDTDVPQSLWNTDTLDGKGPSGVTADWTKPLIFFIRFGWLGLNDPEFGVVIGSKIYICHKFAASNVLSGVYMSTPNLPVRYQLLTTASSPGTSMEAICCQIHASGGQQPNGIIRSASTAGTHLDAAAENSIYALIGIKLKSTHISVAIDLLDLTIQLHTGSHKVEWGLYWNPTVADTFTYSGITNSAIEVAFGVTANTVTLAGEAFLMQSGFAESGGVQAGSAGSMSASLTNALRLGALIDGTTDAIVLGVRPISGSTDVDIEGSLTWRELD